MNTRIRQYGAVLAIGALAAVASACSSSTPSASTGTTVAAASSKTEAKTPDKTEPKATGTTGKATGTTVSSGTNVTVKMKEWEFTPSASSAKAGAVTFTAQNDGKEVHELVLFKTDLDPKSLPVDEEGAVDERATGLELIDEVEDVEAGTSKSFTVDQLAPGKYVIMCNTVDKGEKHYGGHQMFSAFTVT